MPRGAAREPGCRRPVLLTWDASQAGHAPLRALVTKTLVERSHPGVVERRGPSGTAPCRSREARGSMGTGGAAAAVRQGCGGRSPRR